MDPIVFIILAALLIGAAFYLVALPLIQHARRNTGAQAASSEQEHLAELLAQRDAAFQALRELNFDHRVGKISDEDFVAFEANLKQHAAETLRALDRWEAESDDSLDAAMERAIRSRRSNKEGATSVRPDGRMCQKCGAPAQSGDRFCGKCGAPLGAGAAPAAPAATGMTCATCGQPRQPGDRFCGKCGQSFVAEVAPAAH